MLRPLSVPLPFSIPMLLPESRGAAGGAGLRPPAGRLAGGAGGVGLPRAAEPLAGGGGGTERMT